MLLHKAKKTINEENIKKILEAGGIKIEETKIRALVAALDGVDIEKAIKEASIPIAASTVQQSVVEKKEEKPKEEAKKAESDAAAGLGALFG